MGRKWRCNRLPEKRKAERVNIHLGSAGQSDARFPPGAQKRVKGADGDELVGDADGDELVGDTNGESCSAMPTVRAGRRRRP